MRLPTTIEFGLLTLFFVSLRYFLSSFFFVYLIRSIGGTAWQGLQIQAKLPSRVQMVQEIKCSVLPLVLFAVLGALCYHAVRSGWTLLYLATDARQWGIHVATILGLILLHDAYFYWTHRLSHEWRWFYRRFHATHHRFANPSPFSEIAFHPVDALVHVGYIPLFLFTIPTHPIDWLVFLTVTGLANTLGHCGIEVMPQSWRTRPLLRWLNPPTVHNLHHQKVHANYGIYLLVWDTLCSTLVGPVSKVAALESESESHLRAHRSQLMQKRVSVFEKILKNPLEP